MRKNKSFYLCNMFKRLALIFVLVLLSACGGSSGGSDNSVNGASPDTNITSGPNSLTNATSASFVFTSTATGASFECAIDGGTYVACTSSESYTGLAVGDHTFNVRATDAAGNTDATPAAYTWTIDTNPPDTNISSGPGSLTNATSATFVFTSTEAGASFECAIDGGTYVACTSSKSYTGLADGSHTFSVRALDAAGNTDATPAAYTWDVDTSLPDTNITSGPASLTNATSATFVFNSTETGASFECAIDGGAYAACTSSKSYAGLADGSHTFNVQATDAAGNTDPTPATYTWTVDTTPPVVTVPKGITVIDQGGGTPATNTDIQSFLSAATAADNLSGDLTSGITNDAPTTFPLGVTTVTFSVTDAAGNTGKNTSTVEVIAGTTATPSEGELIWAKRAGDASSDEGVGIASLPDGGSVVTGIFGGTATFGSGETNETTLTSAGSNDIFVAHYNADGTLAWARSAGGTSSDLSFSVASFSDGSSVVTGTMSGAVTFGLGEVNQTILTSAGSNDIFVARYNADGTLAWAKKAGGSGYDQGLGIASFSDGSSIVTGMFAETSVFGAGEVNETSLTATITNLVGTGDLFIARYNADGTLAWVKNAAGTAGVSGSDIVTFSDGSAVVVGSFSLYSTSGTATFGIGETNETVLTTAGGEDIFVARYNADGTLAWAKMAGGTSTDKAESTASFKDGSSITTGEFIGTVTFGAGEVNQTSLTASGTSNDIFVARYNADGTLAWAKKAGGIGDDQGSGVASFTDGTSVVTGSFLGTGVFGPGESNETSLIASGVGDVFVAHYNADGTLAGARRAGGAAVPGIDWGRDIASYLDGSSIVTGSFLGAAEFGSGEVNQTILTSLGSKEIFIAKFSQQQKTPNIITLTWKGLVSSVSGGTTQQQNTLTNLGVIVGATVDGVITIDMLTPGADVPSIPERKFFEGAVIDMNMTIGGWFLEDIRPGHVDIDVGTSWMFRARSDCCPGSAGAIDSPDIIDSAEDISFSLLSADPNFLPQTLTGSVPNLVEYFPSSLGATANAVNIFDINGVRVLVNVTNIQ